MGKPGTAVPGVGCQEKESRRDGTSAARKGDTQIRAVPGGTRHDSAQVTRHLHAGLSYPAPLRVEILESPSVPALIEIGVRLGANQHQQQAT